MPIYEYQCEQCGKTEEAIQKFSDAPLTTCGSCSGKLHKLISQSSFHLKGTRWYVTDYANKSKPSSPNSESKESSKTTESSDSTKKTDQKSE